MVKYAFCANVTLAWDPSPDPVTGYIVFYADGVSVLTNPSNSIEIGNILQYTITGLTVGHKYYFAVKAKYYNNISSFSNEVNYIIPAGTTSSTTSSTIPFAPNRPIGLRISNN